MKTDQLIFKWLNIKIQKQMKWVTHAYRQCLVYFKIKFYLVIVIVFATEFSLEAIQYMYNIMTKCNVIIVRIQSLNMFFVLLLRAKLVKFFFFFCKEI